ncbi:unnamed protein product [Angiostrongylus costaricensis]|uniref:CAP-Gly domain-containing protein n=1 Tax=Angiostrongylus costaricensis TaxID=334426 RepID=A0A158PLY1_ANGCS|nr:unnamed protein product [Angiostrongylus costaricensis]
MHKRKFFVSCNTSASGDPDKLPVKAHATRNPANAEYDKLNKLKLKCEPTRYKSMDGSCGPGDRARVDHRSGTVAYVGPVRFAPGEWIGLILDEPLGKNDGSVQGHRYFCCKPEHGLFCKSSKLERIVLSPSRLKASTFGDGEPISPYALEYGWVFFLFFFWSNYKTCNPSVDVQGQSRFDIGDRVVVSGGKHGSVRFIGETEFAQGIWAGIELEQPLGKNDGSIQGKRYFTCKPPYGVFVLVSKVTKASSQTPGKMTPKNYSVSSTGYTARIKALEEALKEKERHLEQVMRERDMERSDISQLSSGDHAEKIAKLESEKKSIKNVLLEKEKILEDLTFRLEEETISKDCKIEELQKKLASLTGEHSGTRTVTADMTVLTNQLSTVEGDNERFKKLLEEERAKNKANNDLLETLRNELEKTKEQLSIERFAFEEKLIVANGAVEEKEILLKKATNGSMEIEKELVKVRAKLELAVKEAQDQKEIVKVLTTSNESKETIFVDKLSVLEKDLQAKVKDLHSMEMNNKVLEVSVLSLEKELTGLKSDLEVLHKEKALLQEALEAANTERATADEILNEKDKEIQWIKDYLMENITVLTAREESMKTTENSLETKTECSFLEDNGLQEQLNALKDNLKASNEEHLRCVELEKQLREAEARIAEEENALASKEKEIVALNEHLKTVESKHENEVDLLISKHAEHIEKLDSLLKSVQSANQELLEKSRDLELKVADLDENLLAGQQLFNEKEKELSDKITSAAAQWKVTEANLVEELKKVQEISAKLTSEKNELEKLTEKTVELEELSRKLRSDLTQKDVELEMTQKERNDAVMAREAAESQVSAVTLQMQEERNILDSNQALASQTKMQYDQLCNEQSQLKEALERLELENRELLTKLAASQSESAAVQLLNEELAASNNLVNEYLKDKEKLVSKQSLVDQQQKLSVHADRLEEKVGKEFEAIMGEVQSVTDQRTLFEKEVEKLKEELAEKQKEVTSFQLNEVNANLLVSEAKQKIELYNELEEDWKKKQLRMSEKIDELTTQLEQARARTQCDEIRSLRNEYVIECRIFQDCEKQDVEEEAIELPNSIELHENGVCMICAGREAEIRKWQEEVDSLKEEIAVITSNARELQTKLLDTLSTGTKEKEQMNKELIENLRSELLEKEEKIKKDQETISALTDARSTSEEINASLQEMVTSLSEQLKSVILEKEKAVVMRENAEAQLGEWRAKVDELTKQLDNFGSIR